MQVNKINQLFSVYKSNLYFFFQSSQETLTIFQDRWRMQELSYNYVVFYVKQHQEDFNSTSQVERVKYVQRVRNISFIHSYQSSIIKTRLPFDFAE